MANAIIATDANNTLELDPSRFAGNIPAGGEALEARINYRGTTGTEKGATATVDFIPDPLAADNTDTYDPEAAAVLALQIGAEARTNRPASPETQVKYDIADITNNAQAVDVVRGAVMYEMKGPR